jgi:excisionase family DNA binding protein
MAPSIFAISEQEVTPLQGYTAPGLLSVKQVAQILGVKPSTIYLWAATRRLPAIYLSPRAIRFERKVIDEYKRLHTTGRL